MTSDEGVVDIRLVVGSFDDFVRYTQFKWMKVIFFCYFFLFYHKYYNVVIMYNKNVDYELYIITKIIENEYLIHRF